MGLSTGDTVMNGEIRCLPFWSAHASIGKTDTTPASKLKKVMSGGDKRWEENQEVITVCKRLT